MHYMSTKFGVDSSSVSF